VSPGAPSNAPGLPLTDMKKNDASERAAALIHRAVDVLQRAAQAPDSPVSTFTSPKVRRQLRRDAARLRSGKAWPRYVNLHTSEELAGVYERTARRDEMVEQTREEFRKISFELGRVLEENGPAVEAALNALLREAKRAAEEQGPASEAAARYRQLVFLGLLGRQSLTRRRRRRDPAPQALSLTPDPRVEVRYAVSAAELLSAPPSPDEPVVAIPPEGGGSGRERMFFRIGIGEWSWIGSFARGQRPASTVSMMPDDKHLFVSAEGAGYVIEARSRTLVETVGTDVVRVIHDEPLTLFVVDHGGRSLEAFGRTGRLWKADGISSGGFRGLRLAGHALFGEARQWWRTDWVEFAVSLATGEVWFGR
jgi:hypothetical protein